LLSQTLESIDSRVGDWGFWLQAGRAAMVFSCSEADEGGFWVGPGRRGRERCNETKRPSEGVLGKDGRKTAEQRGESATLIDVWKQRLACARTFPEAEAAIPGGANRCTEIISIQNRKYSVVEMDDGYILRKLKYTWLSPLQIKAFQ
jgi:hypothetical protein